MSYELKECIICKNPFYIYLKENKPKNKRHGTKKYPLRKSTSKTCSRECSRKYTQMIKGCKVDDN